MLYFLLVLFGINLIQRQQIKKLKAEVDELYIHKDNAFYVLAKHRDQLKALGVPKE